MVRNLWNHRDLIAQFTKRELVGRYRGAYLGLLWAFLIPLLMLTIYTFVFSEVLNARWTLNPNEPPTHFALTMFCGLIVFNILAECLTRSPSLILGNPNFVKKVIFPLEILPVSLLGASFVHGAICLAILIVGQAIFLPEFPATLSAAWLFPIWIVPLVALTLGLSWFVAALGVFVRDIGQAITIIVQMLFFMTPIFYPVTLVPEGWRWVLRINPLTTIVEGARATLIEGRPPDWGAWGVVTVLSLVAMQLGYVWMMKCRRGFADVV